MSKESYASRYTSGDTALWQNFDAAVERRNADILSMRDSLWLEAARRYSGLVVVAPDPGVAEQREQQWLANRKEELHRILLETDIAGGLPATGETMLERASKEARQDLGNETRFQFELTTMMAHMQYAFERENALDRTQMAWLNWAFQTKRHERNDGHVLRAFYCQKLGVPLPGMGGSGYAECERHAKDFIAADSDAHDILGILGNQH